jgi:enamine deaminase RidA (YjgF/YER057c/UK114 family)
MPASGRRNFSSGSPWEPKFGYSRAVRAGPHVHVAGTTGTDAAGNVVSDDAYGQAKAALDKIETVLAQAGASMKDVVRTRIYVTHIADFDAIARAHSERFADVRPASTLVEVSAFVAPGMLVEIEADAYVEDGK